MDARLAAWLEQTHGAPTPAQVRTIPLLEEGKHVLLSSPTGSGKTLSAFLPVLSELAREPLEDKTYCVYVSPLKALVNDMWRNLMAPVEGAGLDIRIGVRTGDTTPAERARQAKRAPHVLVTTPESLAILLASPKARANLRGVRWLIVDEIHSIAESKRGAQLMLTLERLAAYVGEFQRVGLSATVRPLEEVASFLGGNRPVEVVEMLPHGAPELEVAMPVPDPLALPYGRLQEHIIDLVETEMARSRTLLVFTNTRAGAEALARLLRARHEPSSGDIIEAVVESDLIMPHHGSMSRELRISVEERLKGGDVRCVVASSSLELGIHVDHVDRVLLLGSPKGSARTLQRMGRSGHAPGKTARATLLVTDPCDLPEAHALQRLTKSRRVEDVRIPQQPLDVLMQHLCAVKLELPLAPDAIYEMTRRAHSYQHLSRQDFDEAYEEIPRVPRHEYLQNAGTIPESNMLKVFHGDRYVGEVDEEFASSLEEGALFLLAGRAWRFVRSGLARVHVTPARGDADVPTWRGEGLGATGLLAAEVNAVLSQRSTDYPWMELQTSWVGSPAEGALVENFPEMGHRAYVFHAMLGRRANAALARFVEARTGERVMASDWGFAIFAQRSSKPSRTALLRILDAPIGPVLRESLGESELMRRRFRHVAMRALAIRKREGEGLGMRQKHANRLLKELPEGHPLLREAMHECLHDAMDVDAAEAWRESVIDGRRPLQLVERPCASPWGARIVAPFGEARHSALREHQDAISMYGSIVST